jgi:hypothetical protein
MNSEIDTGETIMAASTAVAAFIVGVALAVDTAKAPKA